MKTGFIVAFSIMIIALLTNNNQSDNNLKEAKRDVTIQLFLNYITYFDEYYQNHKTEYGDVTDKVALPTWMPIDTSIRMYVNPDAAYVFMPSSSGILSGLLKITENSAMVGYSDSNNIITLAGKITKPAFIPSGYIVYVR
ncbi:type IV pilus biogenesis protein PilM [Phytobacter ursingii]